MKEKKITPGQIFFRQRNNSSVEFALVTKVRGSQIIYDSIGETIVEGSTTAMSVEVKPNPENRIDRKEAIMDYNEFIGYTFGGNLYTWEILEVPYIPAYQLLTEETIVLHDKD